MERVRIAALFADKEQYGGASVTVCGWAKTIRDMKTFGFIELNDGSCFRNLQVVMDANSLSNYKEIAAQNVGAALIVRGTVVLTPEAKQPLEVKATEIEIEGVSSPRLSPAEKAPQRRISAHHSASAPAHEPLLRGFPCEKRGGLRRARVLPEPRLRLRQHPHHHRL